MSTSWKDKYKKAVTFSYDDGVTQDIRMINLLNKYGLKATFNLNSELLGTPWMLSYQGVRASHYKVSPNDVKAIYAGHEVAVHTLTHPRLPELDDAEVIRQVETDSADTVAELFTPGGFMFVHNRNLLNREYFA